MVHWVDLFSVRDCLSRLWDELACPVESRSLLTSGVSSFSFLASALSNAFSTPAATDSGVCFGLSSAMPRPIKHLDSIARLSRIGLCTPNQNEWGWTVEN